MSCRSSTWVPGARYCARCGAPLQAPLWSDKSFASRIDLADDAPSDTRECGRCGKSNPAENSYCAFCGSRIEAGAHARSASEADRQRAAELTAAARQELAAGHAERAHKLCADALSLDSRSAGTHMLLAEVYRAEGSLAGALQAMTAAVRLDPDNPELERQLRELRDEQDRAVAPVLRMLGEADDRPLRSPRRRPRRQPTMRAHRPARTWYVPEWVKALGLVGVIMLLLWQLPGLMSHLQLFVGILVCVLAARWVYGDARSSGISLGAAIMWAAAAFTLVGLIVYLLVTRARR